MPMPDTMEIEFFGDCGDEPWAIFTKGHIDLKAFKRAAARKIKEWDIRDEVESAALGHFYMRELASKDAMEADDGDAEHPWHWCEAGDIGAIAVTAYKF